MTDVDPSLFCSFCAKSARDVKKLIKGPEAFICDECVDLCHDVLYKTDTSPEEAAKTAEEAKISHTPRSIREHLDRYVIGQADAKVAVAVAVYDHYKRLANPPSENDDIELEKSNILLLGPTGSGKTLIAQSIARLLDVPFAIADATSLTEAGYVGEDVESVITRLLQAAEGDPVRAERGIVYLDEIDKKARRSEMSTSRDVSGEGVQQGLLKLLEGSEIMVPINGRKSPNGELVKINTKNILFICGGAFVGMDKIIEKSVLKDSVGIGFGAKSIGRKIDTSLLLNQIEAEHLTKFGLIPELVGRLPILAPLLELNDEELVQVLTEPKNAVTKQFQKLFSLDGVELEFQPDALTEIAKLAKKRKTGARGLRGVVENLLLKLKYNLPDLCVDGIERVIITPEVVAGVIPPLLVFKPKETPTPEAPVSPDEPAAE